MFEHHAQPQPHNVHYEPHAETIGALLGELVGAICVFAIPVACMFIALGLGAL